MGKEIAHTTIGLKKVTKERLNSKKAPGQCFDGFLCQLMDLWDEIYEDPLRLPQKTKLIKKGGAEISTAASQVPGD